MEWVGVCMWWGMPRKWGVYELVGVGVHWVWAVLGAE